jgi:hypothetical protein
MREQRSWWVDPPEAMPGCLQPGICSRSLSLKKLIYLIGSTSCIAYYNYRLLLFLFLSGARKAFSMGVAPSYVRVLLVEDRLEFAYSPKYFNPSTVLNLFQ